VDVDAQRFDHVLSNLLSNALERSERGTTVTVTTRANCDRGGRTYRLAPALSRLGADGFLGKPFEPAQLVALARAVIGARPDS